MQTFKLRFVKLFGNRLGHQYWKPWTSDMGRCRRLILFQKPQSLGWMSHPEKSASTLAITPMSSVVESGNATFEHIVGKTLSRNFISETKVDWPRHWQLILLFLEELESPVSKKPHAADAAGTIFIDACTVRNAAAISFRAAMHGAVSLGLQVICLTVRWSPSLLTRWPKTTRFVDLALFRSKLQPQLMDQVWNTLHLPRIWMLILWRSSIQ